MMDTVSLPDSGPNCVPGYTASVDIKVASVFMEYVVFGYQASDPSYSGVLIIFVCHAILWWLPALSQRVSSCNQVLPTPVCSQDVRSMDKGSKKAEEYIREQARFYGRDPTKVLTPYQKINLAAEELAVGTPSLLHTQQKLLELARTKVDDDGYLQKRDIQV